MSTRTVIIYPITTVILILEAYIQIIVRNNKMKQTPVRITFIMFVNMTLFEILSICFTGCEDHMPGRISSIRDLCAAFGIHCNSSIIHNMPSFEQRSNLLNWESDGVPGAMKNVLRLYDKIFHAVAAIVCGPKAAQCSIDAMLKKEQITEERKTADNLLSNIKEVICSTKRSSLERRTATSILCSSCSTYQKDGVIGLQLNRRSFSRAKKDFRSMTTAGYLSPSAFLRPLFLFSTYFLAS